MTSATISGKTRTRKKKTVEIDNSFEAKVLPDLSLVTEKALVSETKLGDVVDKLLRPFRWLKNTFFHVCLQDPQIHDMDTHESMTKSMVHLLPIFILVNSILIKYPFLMLTYSLFLFCLGLFFAKKHQNQGKQVEFGGLLGFFLIDLIGGAFGGMITYMSFIMLAYPSNVLQNF